MSEETKHPQYDTAAAVAELERLAGRSMETGQSPYFQLALIATRALVALAGYTAALAKQAKAVAGSLDTIGASMGGEPPEVLEVRLVNKQPISVEARVRE